MRNNVCYIYRYRPDTGEFYNHTGEHSRNIPWTVPLIMVMSTDGPVIIWRLEGRLDQVQYLAFLEELVRVLQATDVTRRERQFVHDYRPVFRSRAVQSWLSSQTNLQQAPWTPESPDFMPLVPPFNEILASLNSVFHGPRRRRLNSHIEMWQEILPLWNTYDKLGVFIHILKCESSLRAIYDATFGH